MPKVVSRSAVSSSTDAQPTASSVASLRVYYCICGEFILVIDKNLTALPRRKMDNAIIIRAQDTDTAKARTFKLNVTVNDPILLQRWEQEITFNGQRIEIQSRQNGHEKQYRFLCTRCSLPIGYQCSPLPIKSAAFVYILPGALTQIQGQVPTDAFDSDE